MKNLPTITMNRINLRPFTMDDSSEVQTLAGDEYVAKTTLYIPHPYEDGEAEKWIKTHEEECWKGRALTLAVEDKESRKLMGAITLGMNKAYDHGEIAYWVGKPYMNKGYCTEAAKGLIQYGFEELNLHRIYARYMDNNPASGKVMEKLGMKYEGVLREHVKKWGKYYDLYHYGILRHEFKIGTESVVW